MHSRRIERIISISRPAIFEILKELCAQLVVVVASR
jgi:hypothetical protein